MLSLHIKYMKSCNKCLMPDTAETLTFDAQGVCSVCNQNKENKKLIGPRELKL